MVSMIKLIQWWLNAGLTDSSGYIHHWSTMMIHQFMIIMHSSTNHNEPVYDAFLAKVMIRLMGWWWLLMANDGFRCHSSWWWIKCLFCSCRSWCMMLSIRSWPLLSGPKHKLPKVMGIIPLAFQAVPLIHGRPQPIHGWSMFNGCPVPTSLPMPHLGHRFGSSGPALRSLWGGVTPRVKVVGINPVHRG